MSEEEEQGSPGGAEGQEPAEAGEGPGVEDEAQERDGEGSGEGDEEASADSSDDEGEDEEGNEYEVDGFVVDEADEEEGEGEEGGDTQRKKKRRKRHKELQLDDEDYDLLEENQVKVKRPTGHKRLKRAEEGARGDQDAAGLRNELFGNDEDLEDELEDDDEGAEEEEEGERRGRGGRASQQGTGARQSKGERSNKGARAGRGEPGHGGSGRGRDEAPPPDEDLMGMDDDDEMGDFIVDEGPGGAGRSRRRRAAAYGMPGISAAMLEEAGELFGDVDALLEMYREKAGAPGGQGFGADEDAELEILPEEPAEGEEEEEGAAEAREQARAEASRKAVLRKAMRHMDRETLEAQFLMPRDQEIRRQDAPERFQLLGVGPGKEGDELNLDACAEWIYFALFEASDIQGRQLPHVARIVEEGVVELDANSRCPTPAGWPRSLLSDPKREADDREEPRVSNELKRTTLKLGSRRAVRRPLDRRERKHLLEDDAAQQELKNAIRHVLGAMYEKGEEPLLLGLYRKEGLGPLAAMREQERPQVTSEQEWSERMNNFAGTTRAMAYDPHTVQARHRRIRRFDVLWSILLLSLRFRKVWRRRQQLLKRLDAVATALEDEDGASGGFAARQAARADVSELRELGDALPVTCCDSQLSDLDAKLRLVQDAHSTLLTSLGSLSLGGTQGGPRSGRAGAGGGGGGGAMYRGMSAAGVGPHARKHLLSPAQFATNTEDPENPVHQVDDPQQYPKEWFDVQISLVPLAAHNVDARGDVLLNRIKMMAAQELCVEPHVRANVREYFYENAVVTTKPTAAGRDHPLLEPYAKYGRVRRYQDKPLHTFAKTDNFLRVAEAVRERLITMTLELPESEQNKLMEDYKAAYQSSNTSKYARTWNEMRAEIVTDAIVVRLLPIIATEARQVALAAAKEVALEEYSNEFWKLASACPLRVKLPEEDTAQVMGEVVLERPRIMSICWGPDSKQPTVAVALDEQGGLVDLLPLGHLSGNISRQRGGPGDGPAPSPLTDPRKSKDAQRLLEKIRERLPHAIVVGMSDPSAGVLLTDLQALRDHILDQHARDVQNLENQFIEVHPADERLATLWQDCKAAKEEFPEQPPHVRRAIALGRAHLDPLAVLAALCGSRAEVMAMQLTEVQGAIQGDDKTRVVEELMVTAASQVGVDINLAANVPWRRHTLQFVPGLGPRKAQALLQAVARNGNRVESRNFMYKELGDVMGRTVFRNCGACLRVTDGALPALSNMELRQLDNSRIHPESYRQAVALCSAATGDEDVEAAVEEHKDKLEVVDLAALAEQRACKLATLIDIQQELLIPFGELRLPGRAVKDREAFLLMHGETEGSLCAGRLVEAKVMYVGREEVKVRLTHAPLDGVIQRADLSSQPDWQHGDLREKLQRDQVLRCRILDLHEVSFNNSKVYVLRLSSNSNQLNPIAWEKLMCVGDKEGESYYEPHYHVETAEERQKALAEARSTPTRATTPNRTTPTRTTPNRDGAGPVRADKICERPITHPLYKNITQKDAVKFLSESAQMVGACVLRPGPTSSGLHLSVKVHSGSAGAVVVNFKVLEAPHRAGPSNALRTPLKIELDFAGGKHYEFEDVDELHARFVEPLVSHATAFASHRKFCDSVKGTVDEKVSQEWTAARGASSPYYLGVSSDRGVTSWFISFAVNSRTSPCKVHHEYLHCTPDGYYFRKKDYDDLERVIAVFKKQPISKEREKERAALGYGLPAAMPQNMASGVVALQQPAPPANYTQQQMPYNMQGWQPAMGTYAAPAQAVHATAYGSMYTSGYGAPPAPGAYGAPPATYSAPPPPGAYGAPPPPAYGGGSGGAYGGAPSAAYAGGQGQYAQPAGVPPPPGAGSGSRWGVPTQ